MSPLARLLLIPAALSLWSTVALAKDIKGAPKELIGYYGADADACRSYNRSGGDKLITIRKTGFSECMGKFRDKEVSPYGRQMPDVMERAAHYATLDKREIKTFCKDVLDAFGKNGRVSPGLINDVSRQN